MVTNTILRNVLLLEGKDYTPEQIDDILNNRLQAINYVTNIADRPSYAAALDLRSRAILTEAGKVLLDNGESIIDFESKDIINKALDDDALLVNILSKQFVAEYASQIIL